VRRRAIALRERAVVPTCAIVLLEGDEPGQLYADQIHKAGAAAGIEVQIRVLPAASRTEDVVRWLYFVALAFVIGSLGFRLLCLRAPVGERVAKRLSLLAAVGVVGVLELGIASFLLRCADVLQLPFGKYLYGDLSPISAGTRFGKAFIVTTLLFALVAALIYLAWLLDRPRLLLPAFAISVASASGLSLSGHDAVDPGSSWSTVVFSTIPMPTTTICRTGRASAESRIS